MKRLQKTLASVQKRNNKWLSAGVLALIAVASVAVASGLGNSENAEQQEIVNSFYVNAGYDEAENCGAADWAGVTWQADQPYSPGSWGYTGDYNVGSWDYSPYQNVEGDDQGLHRCRSWGTNFGYQFDTPNGEYKVRLRFAEPLNEAGQRLFDVNIEGQKVLDNFDIYTEAGGAQSTAVEREFTVMVEDGQLNIDFAGEPESEDSNALVQAIAVEGQFTPEPPAEQPTDEPTDEAQPTEAPPEEQTPEPQPSADIPAGSYAQFVNLGECTAVNWQGVEWAAPQPYSPGSWGYVGTDHNPIPDIAAGEVVDENGELYGAEGQYLHRCQTYGTDFGYQFDVPNSNYNVVIRFSDPVRPPGGRWFDVVIEGQTVLDDFDPAAEAGRHNTGLEKTFQVNVTDNRLDITFVGNQQDSPDQNAFAQAIGVMSEELAPEPTEEPTEVPPTPVPTEDPATEEPGTQEPDDVPTEVTATPDPIGIDETLEPTTETPTEAPAIDRDTWFVNAGQCGSVDWQGYQWEADQPYTPGSWGHVGSSYEAVSDGLTDTVLDQGGAPYDDAGQYLHGCQVYGTDFGYHFDMPEGEYIVSLRFAEPMRLAGQRWFDIVVEGQTVLDNFDVAAQAGGMNVTVEQHFGVTVTDGTLEIDFVGNQDGSADSNAFVQALAVVKADQGLDLPTPEPPVEEPTATPVPPTAVPTEVQPEPTDIAPTLEPTVTAEVTATPLPTEEVTDDETVSDYVQYVNVGECEAVQWDGGLWADDQPYTQGSWGYFGSDYTDKSPGLAQVNDASGNRYDSSGQYLHRCRSYGTDFGYRFDVPNGSYTVTFRFVEPLYNSADKRHFDVALEGQIVLDDFDIAAEAGGDGIALEVSFPVTVSDGQLQINFMGGAGASDTKAIVQAISVVGGGASPGNDGTPPVDETPQPTAVSPTATPVAPTAAPEVTPSPEPTQEPTPEPTPDNPTDYVQFVNVGSCDNVQWQGVTWADDQPYTQGGWGYVGDGYTEKSAGLVRVSDASGSEYDESGQYLFRCRSYGPDFGYRFDVPNGDYDVTLYFVEPVYDNAGRRAFDVELEDQLVLDNLDIAAEVGGEGIMLARNFPVEVSDGQLKLDFVGGSGVFDGKGVVQAISVVPQGYQMPDIPVDEVPNPGDQLPTPTPDAGNETDPVSITHTAVNPSAMPAANQILSYLYDLPNRSDNRVVAGQFGSYGDGATVSTAQDQVGDIYDQTGMWPALTGMDYRNWDMYHGNNLSDANRYLIDYWNAGGLVTLSWHAENPWTGGSSNDMDITSLSDLTTPGSPGYDEWIRMLDNIASGLQELEDAGVVVIWRPLHEMNGGWFWWWGNEDPEGYKQLWRHMFNYFTYQKGLDNLLWAWSPNYAYDQWTADLLDYYPGGNYVDIVGMDKYRGLDESPLEMNGWGTYDKLVSTGKPVALLEFGPSPASSWPDRPDWDYTELIERIQSQYPRIVMFQAWEWHWQIAENQGAEGLMSHPWTIDRSEVPNWVGGEGTGPASPPVTEPAPTPTPEETAEVPVDAGTVAKWSTIEIPLEGENTSATNDASNPFATQVDVTFTGPGGQIYNVPAFYDGDGQGGSSGNVWMVRFTPDTTGDWTYESSSGEAALDGLAGTFSVNNPSGCQGYAPGGLPDIDCAGRLQYVGGPYLKFAEGSFWVKGGADEPEDFLAPGETVGFGSKEAAIDYLASRGVNSLYMLMQNIGGDGQNVWPWLGSSPSQAQSNDERFDLSKLDEWEDTFDYLESRGLVLHLVLEDDSGWSGFDRQMYYREMVARFAHHNAIVWNISEEYNENYSSGQVQGFAQMLRDLDPYDHPITVHNEGSVGNWNPFVGDQSFNLTSLQISASAADANGTVIDFRNRTEDAGHTIPVSIDEAGSISSGDRTLSRQIVWATYLAGGNYEMFTADLYDYSDFSGHFDDMTRARRFVEHLPFWEMEAANSLLSGGQGGYMFAKRGEVYAAYLLSNSSVQVNLRDASGTLQVTWYNPRTGETTSGGTVRGGGTVTVQPPFSGDAVLYIGSSALGM